MTDKEKLEAIREDLERLKEMLLEETGEEEGPGAFVAFRASSFAIQSILHRHFNEDKEG